MLSGTCHEYGAGNTQLRPRPTSRPRENQLTKPMNQQRKSETSEYLKYLTPQEKGEIAKLLEPTFWRKRLKGMFSNYLWNELSPPHEEMHEWANSLGANPAPFVAIWSRARGKSTHAEIIAADWGARGVRKYVLYVSGTQDQADKHVSTVASMLESKEVTNTYPEVGVPKLGKNGSRTWNRSMVTTANGFTIEAIGLNKATRGGKIDWARVDGIILDDVDGKHDTEATTKKKREIITTSILPAGAKGCAVLFCQNLLKRGSIAHELNVSPADGGAKYLTRRIISGPHPAVEGLDYELKDGEWIITKGKSLWKGFSLADCQAELNIWGPSAYEKESQHNVDADNPSALLTTEVLDAVRVNSHPPLDAVGVGVDPSGGKGRCGIIASGKAKVANEWHAYTIDDNSTEYGTSAAEWGEAVLWCYHKNNADFIIVERNFGGDMATNTIRQAVIEENGAVLLRGKHLKIIEVSASRGKKVRAQPVAALKQRGISHHVGYFPKLEKEWVSWEPGDPSPDRLDAEVWIVTHLLVTDKTLSIPKAKIKSYIGGQHVKRETYFGST